jgi:hypothetical protein
MPRSDPQARRDYELRRRYGLAEGGYDALLAAQGGGCAICSKKPRTKALALDHDHRTGRIRGLLCTGLRGCNKALGPFEADAEVARRAAAYLLEIAADLERQVLTKMSHAKGKQ